METGSCSVSKNREMKMEAKLFLGILIGMILASGCLKFGEAGEAEPELRNITDLMLHADELPSEWKSLGMHEYHYIRYIERPEIKMVWNTLQYTPTGGPATIRVYKDPDRIVFNEEFGWAKDRDSAIQKVSYRGVPVFKYRTFMGYLRYLTHMDGYTFIFNAGIYGTDSWESSEAPERDTDELFKAVISHALSRNLMVSEIEIPTKPGTNLTIHVVPVEMIPLRITYEGRDKRIVPTGYLEWGTLKVLNHGEEELKGLFLKLAPKKELTPAEIDVIKHTPGRQIEEQDIQLIQDVTIKPDAIFIEKLKPSETREFPIEITIQGEGNYFGIEVFHENMSIWGMQGFVD